MPKTTPKSKTKTKQPNIWAKAFTWCKRHPVLTTVIIIVVGLFGYIAISSTVHQLQINKERKQYAQLRTDMDSLYAQIVKQVGEPVGHKVVPSCRYASALTGLGARSCRIDSYFSYVIEDDSAASTMADKLSRAVREQPLTQNYKVFEWVEKGAGYSLIKSANFMLEKSVQGCSDNYWVRDRTEGGDLPNQFPASISPDKALLVRLSCSGGDRAEYFPVIRDGIG